MQNTMNYLWKTDDVLGQGATASVYKARNKKSGVLVAVKVFNNASYLRPQEVQIREFEVLKKLNHQNIVKLFAVEEIESCKQKVLVMEYCSGGSLLSLLEDPENAFGLTESEFLIVLRCVVAGMNHLRENGVVHRDIKPGNIMRLIGEDRQSIYKLTDFGAARELDDDEKFESVYGTEEYLHPDMYKRAVLKKPQRKAYGVAVDLWSIGVTFYHAATGSLPFIPFGGPRRNKETMYKITTDKPTGAIAGTQEQENGAIVWTYELPITCQLSHGLKRQLVPILANILEANQEECWGFDQFFAETNDILHRMIVHIFSLPQATMHQIYIHSYNTATIFLEEVFRQTNIAPHHQEYFFEGHSYELEPNLQASHFPKTTETCPLIMLSTEPEDPVMLKYRDPALEFPKFLPKVDVIADCSTAKDVLAATHQTLRISQSFLRCQELILRGLYWVSETLKAKCLQILEKKQDTVAILSCSQGEEMKILLLFETVAGDLEIPEIKGLAEMKTRLQAVDEQISKCSQSISEHQSLVQCILSEMGKKMSQIKEVRSIQLMEACLDKMQLIYNQFKKARKCRGLGYNEQQIHKLDKMNLGHLAKKVLSVFQDKCLQQYQACLLAHGTRMRKVFEMRKNLKKLSRSLAACSAETSGCQDYLHKALDVLLQRILQSKVTPSAPTQVYLNQKHQDVVFGMQELQDQMKIVAQNLQLNNSIIQRLNGIAPAL
ncbi:inhibitor of nuclear factor kappa-B kinase subunit epsilon isoform X2 [Rhineura floridana]|uniref:inhibitor of nuclear factor kappa-B kinase subunit epsilon isoform X2 n=1 Tax=Rhineura floridana TaxID=261503 RepID=UPI002AC7EC59|nr:inhibitor of nuclear factor kappa-B kinase subunit epsilon isoform X2 [Rhineura floridana]XP_061488092.1 inhibitor of nuclear factor kappa-B kinase subunit epsilon isoform X2 [Rhineura floridana]